MRKACPKCGSTSGDNWTKCEGNCPMPGSPHYKLEKNTSKKLNINDKIDIVIEMHLQPIIINGLLSRRGLIDALEKEGLRIYQYRK